MVAGSIVVEGLSGMLKIVGSIPSIRPEWKNKELTRQN